MVRYLFITPLLFILLSIYLWRVFPISPDEISYFATDTRFMADGFNRILDWMPFCGTHIQKIPLLLYPFAFSLGLEAKIHSITDIRWLGIAYNIIGLILFIFVIYRILIKSYKTEKVVAFLAITYFLLGLTYGLLPIQLVNHRAEQFIFFLFALMLACLYYEDIFKGKIYFRIILGSLLTTVFFISSYYHPKYLYFLPAVLFIIINLFKYYKKIILIFISFIIIISYYDYKMFEIQLFECPEIENRAEEMKSMNINPALLIKEPSVFFEKIINNMKIERFKKYIHRESFSEKHDKSLPGLIPHTRLDTFSFIGNFYTFVFSIFTFIIFNIFFIYICFFIFFNKRFGFEYEFMRDKTIISKIGLFFIMIAPLSSFLLNLQQNYYDSISWTIEFSMISIFPFSLILSKILNKNLVKNKYFIYLFICLLSIGSLTSDFFVLKKIYPILLSGNSGSGIPIYAYNLKNEYQQVEFLENKASINVKIQKIITDDMAYNLIQPSPYTHALTWVWYSINEIYPQKMNNKERFKLLWRETYKYAKKNNFAAIIGYCPSFATGFDQNTILIANPKDWYHSFCLAKVSSLKKNIKAQR